MRCGRRWRARSPATEQSTLIVDQGRKARIRRVRHVSIPSLPGRPSRSPCRASRRWDGGSRISETSGLRQAGGRRPVLRSARRGHGAGGPGAGGRAGRGRRHGASRPARWRAGARAIERFCGEDLDRDRKVRCVRQTDVRGRKGTVQNFRQRDVRGVVCREVGAPRPDAAQHGPVAMALKIEVVQGPNGSRRAIHRGEPRVHVAPEHVEDFEIDQLGAVPGVVVRHCPARRSRVVRYCRTRPAVVNPSCRARRPRPEATRWTRRCMAFEPDHRPEPISGKVCSGR